MPSLAASVEKNRPILTDLFSEYGILAFQVFALLIAFKINRKIEWLAPSLWIFLPISMATMLFRAKYVEAAKPVVDLWKLIGFLSATYSLLHYPLIPPLLEMHSRYAILLIVWGATIIAGILSFRFPSLALLPPAFLLWSINEAKIISGLPITIDIDIMPLTEVSMCIGLGLLVDNASRTFWPKEAGVRSSPKFVSLLFLLAIAVHLSNYFWSFVAKVQLDGSPLLWLTQNNPAALFLTSIDDDHIVFSDYPIVVEWLYWLIDSTHLGSNFLVLSLQATAIAAFFLPRWAFLALLVAFDIMHLSIIVFVGANFWPWILLNLIVAYVVSKNRMPEPIPIKLIATAFILISPRFVAVSPLGWLDSSANNKLSFEAVDKNGTRYVVPTNFFTFYSYPLGHMDYGLPDASIGFEVGSPTGAVFTRELLEASRICDRRALARKPEMFPFKPKPFTSFIQNYHRMVLSIYTDLGTFPYDLYPHHLYIPLALGDGFRRLNKEDVVAYIYKQESVCLSFSGERLQRNVVASSEYRIDVLGGPEQ